MKQYKQEKEINKSDLDSLRKIITLIKMKLVTSIDVKNEKKWQRIIQKQHLS